MKFILITLISLLASSVFSQYQKGLSPKKSPRKTVSSTFGFGMVEISYGSPKQKGRELFGKLVPFGEVWRLGADAATTLSIDTDFKVGETDLKAGKYGIFLRPNKEGNWDFIINSQSEQWGAYDYSDSLDVLVYKVEPVELDFRKENLIIDFEEYARGKGELSIHWGRTYITIPFEVDLMSQFMASAQDKIDATPKTEKWAANLQAAEYLVSEGMNLDQAKDWIKIALKEYKKNGEKWSSQANDYYEGHLLWTQAKVYAAMGKHKKALKIAKAVVENKSEKSFYTFENDKSRENIDEIMAVWKD